jgi:sporulation protein YlmC with PRC-barrel domain
MMEMKEKEVMKSAAKLLTTGALAAVLSAGLPGAASTASAGQSEAREQAPSFERASHLIGMSVRDARGDELGRVEDIVLSEDGTKVSHLAIAPTAAGLGDRRAPATLDKIALSPNGASLSYDSSKSDFEKAATQSAGAEPWSRRVAALLGTRVLDSSDHSAGRIRDLVVDLKSGRVETATIAMGGLLGFGEKLASVDFATMTFPATGAANAARQGRIAMTADDLAKVTYASGDYWEKLGFGETGSPAQSEKPADITPAAPTDPDAKGY